MAAFAVLGYEECEGDSLEEGYEKVALFARNVIGVLEPTHAARQLRDGQWTSKLGPQEDIEHTRAEDVAGPCYGIPVRFMKRKLKTETTE